METYVHLWYYLPQFYLEWEMFKKKVYRKLKHTFHVKCLFRKSSRLWDNVEKYGTARQATDDNIILSMRSACWMTQTHTQNM
jgi:hypothetical protein